MTWTISIAAAKADNLPAVSYVKAVRYQTGHAGGISDPLDEQVFLVKTINALEKTRQWKSMAIVIAFDDSDGDYDHQMSPIFNGSTSPLDALSGTGICGSGDPSLGDAELRCGYGPRLPLLVISPYARRNFVDHTITDLTSIYALHRRQLVTWPARRRFVRRDRRTAHQHVRFHGTASHAAIVSQTGHRRAQELESTDERDPAQGPVVEPARPRVAAIKGSSRPDGSSKRESARAGAGHRSIAGSLARLIRRSP